jgi:hypothetical protein
VAQGPIPVSGWTVPSPQPQLPPEPEIPDWVRRRLAARPVLSTPRRTRWNATPTTLGPAVKLAITAAALVVPVWLWETGFIVLAIPVAVIGAVVAFDAWRSGFAPVEEGPGAGGSPARSAAAGAHRGPAGTRRPPARVTIPTSTKVAWAAGIAVFATAAIATAVGSYETQANVIVGVIITGGVLFGWWAVRSP